MFMIIYLDDNIFRWYSAQRNLHCYTDYWFYPRRSFRLLCYLWTPLWWHTLRVSIIPAQKLLQIPKQTLYFIAFKWNRIWFYLKTCNMGGTHYTLALPRLNPKWNYMKCKYLFFGLIFGNYQPLSRPGSYQGSRWWKFQLKDLRLWQPNGSVCIGYRSI